MAKFTLYIDHDVTFAAPDDTNARRLAANLLTAIDELVDALPDADVQFHEAELRRGSRGKVLLHSERVSAGE